MEKLADNPFVSFVLPAFNEGAVIERVLERLILLLMVVGCVMRLLWLMMVVLMIHV